MHKIFAKPLFLGKKVIFLTECHSTNDEMSSLQKNEDFLEGLVVYTDHQKKGKGQRGNVWLDEPGKNILMSVLLKPDFLRVPEQYLLNVVVGLSVIKSLARHLDEKTLKLKWPNDVLVGTRKICGILVENALYGDRLENSTVGIGVNLNQRAFSLPTATSMVMETDIEFDRDNFIEELLVDLEFFLLKLKNGQKSLLLQLYHEKLYRKGITSTFRDKDGDFEAVILGIDNSGKLIVSRGASFRNYQVKEIEFLE